MLVAYGIRQDGSRHLLAFLRSQGEGQADWEALLQDLYRRGPEGRGLPLILTDGCAGLAAAIRAVYPGVRHQRCWVHKMRNILEKARQCDYDEVKAGAQAIYRAESRAQAEAAFRRFSARWRGRHPGVVKRLGQDLPELLAFFAFPRHLWRQLRTTNVIERCFVEVRRRTRPMVCFVNVESVDRIIYSIFQRFNLEWKTRTLNLFTQASSELEELVKQHKVIPGSRVDLARSIIAMAVRAGEQKPDISTLEGLKRTLLAAKSIAYSGSTSGVCLSTEFQRLGIADAIRSKCMRIDIGVVGTVIARGDAEFGFQQLSELLPIAGIDIVGPIPSEAQKMTVYSGGVAVHSKQLAIAKQFSYSWLHLRRLGPSRRAEWNPYLNS